MKAWFWQHRDAVATTISRLARTPVATLLNLGVIGAALALPIAAAATIAPGPVVAAAVATASLIIARHRDNLRRLINGTERRIGTRA